MATLNGAEFKIIEAEWSTYQNNVIQEILGSDTVEVQNQGHGSEPVRIQAMVNNEKEMDDFQEQFYSNGALTLIKDPDSGRQYQVYALGNVRRENIINSLSDQGIIFTCMMQLKYPYNESVSTITQSKTIVSNNQEFSTDDSGIDIKTIGNVDATPDIKITAGSIPFGPGQLEVDSNYNLNNSLSTVTVTQSTNPMSTDVDSTTVQGESLNLRKAGMGIIDSIQVTVNAVTTTGDVTCTVYNKFGGTSLGSKTINIAGTGAALFTFDTPIAVVQAETTCSDTADANYLYFEISTASADITIGYSSTFDPYPDGYWYEDGVRQGLFDLTFSVVGHSVKEIRQTFKVNAEMRLNHILLNLCKYKYTGSNDCTVTVKQGGTTLGSGAVALSGTDFADVPFYLAETIVGSSLDLVTATEYTIYITPPSDSGNSTGVLLKTKITNEYGDGAVTLVEDGGATRVQTHDLYFVGASYYTNDEVQVYNTADFDTKCLVSNEIFHSAIHRINVDGSGTINIVDVFTTTDFFRNIHTHNGVTRLYSSVSGWGMQVSGSYYAIYKIDTKHPIKTIPILTSNINIITGAPKIQISIDNSTWYNIDTAIVDQVSTDYPLNSTSNLSLLGKTSFYYRYYGNSGNCLVHTGDLNLDIHTIYAKNPKIIKGSSPSTLRVDQNVDSGIACTVDLIFKNRWWV